MWGGLCLGSLVVLAVCVPALACGNVAAYGERGAARTEANVPNAGTSGPRYAPGELAGTEWFLVPLKGKAPLRGHRPSMESGKDAVQGRTGCNSYGSFAASAKGGSIDIGADDMSTIGCSEVVRRREKVSLDSLGASRTYRLEGDRLKLRDEPGRTILVFEKEAR